ncbi:MAG: ATP-grasp fold amidoligase family protein [Desulfobulbus sp.]|nr:ATP-grasp fold amidoligase family protein [Desulfobulbus sp.]
MLKVNLIQKLKTTYTLIHTNPRYILVGLLRQLPVWALNAESYARLLYRAYMGKGSNWKNPHTYYEKINWLKVNYRDPLLAQCADKYKVREFIEHQVGADVLVPLLGVYDSPEKIIFNSLPNSFVLKSSGGNGNNLFVRNKEFLDVSSTFKILSDWLEEDYYRLTREWCYKDSSPVIICEPLLKGDSGTIVPKDYKIYCFRGEPLYTAIFHGRFSENPSQTVYDLDWNIMPFVWDKHFSKNENMEPRPDCYDEMLDICRRLSVFFLHVRVDFYIINNRPLIGELTFFNAGGCSEMDPKEFDVEIGSLLDLSLINKEGRFLGWNSGNKEQCDS